MNRIFMTTATLALLLLWPSGAHGQSPAEVAGGAEVWANNCVRCHNARPFTERTDLQWMVIVSHMRARANLTRTQAGLVTSFLQATNRPPDVVASPFEAPAPVGAAPAPEAAEAGQPASEPSAEGGAGGLDPETVARISRYLMKLLTASGPGAP